MKVVVLMCDKGSIYKFTFLPGRSLWVASKAKNKISVGFSGADQRMTIWCLILLLRTRPF